MITAPVTYIVKQTISLYWSQLSSISFLLVSDGQQDVHIVNFTFVRNLLHLENGRSSESGLSFWKARQRKANYQLGNEVLFLTDKCNLMFENSSGGQHVFLFYTSTNSDNLSSVFKNHWGHHILGFQFIKAICFLYKYMGL